MKKTIRWGMGKLSLLPETLRTLTVPELGHAQGGMVTYSDCVYIDENTRKAYTETTCHHRSNGSCQTCR